MHYSRLRPIEISRLDDQCPHPAVSLQEQRLIGGHMAVSWQTATGVGANPIGGGSAHWIRKQRFHRYPVGGTGQPASLCSAYDDQVGR